MKFPDDAQKRAKERQKSTPAYLSGVIKSSPVLSEYLFVSLPFLYYNGTNTFLEHLPLFFY